MITRFRVTGRGTVELPGYGVADAEHRLEKEIAAALPGATLRVEQVSRLDPAPKIVEEFAIRFTLVAEVPGTGEDEEKARRSAYAGARAALTGTRFEKVRWEKAEVIG